jgi:hypothetical protein
MLVRRKSVALPLLYVALGVSWLIAMSAIDANVASKGNAIVGYGYLVAGRQPVPLTDLVRGAIEHPLRALSALKASVVNDWANTAAPGFIGALSPWGISISLVVILSVGLLSPSIQRMFSRPLFQSFPIYIFVPVGSVFILAWAIRRLRPRIRRAVLAAGTLALAQAIAWAIVWLPNLPTTTFLVNNASATTLNNALRMIPNGDEVIAEEGIAGRFFDRNYALLCDTIPAKFSIYTRQVYFVFGPTLGSERPVDYFYSAIDEIASLPGSHLMIDKNGLWVFEWNVPHGVRSMTLPSSREIGAWELLGKIGHRVVSGQPATWHMGASGPAAGYVVYGAYYQSVRGKYLASVTLSATGRTNVEVWNATAGELITRVKLDDTHGRITVTMPVNLHNIVPEPYFTGVGLFTDDPIPPPTGDNLEIRVYSFGDEAINVYSVALAQSS